MGVASIGLLQWGREIEPSEISMCLPRVYVYDVRLQWGREIEPSEILAFDLWPSQWTGFNGAERLNPRKYDKNE